MISSLGMPAMNKISPQTLGQLLDGFVDVPDSFKGVMISCLAFDSRSVQPGCLYFGLPGSRSHGASYAEQALAAGAEMMITDAAGAKIAGGVRLLAVDDPRRLMGDVAVRLYGDPSADRLTFGVTGTNGKTTTCFMLVDSLRANGLHVGYVGTAGFQLDGQPVDLRRTTTTTPESVDLQAGLAALAQLGADCFVMEASSGGLVMDRLEGVHFDVVGFTNLGRDHIDFHGTLEGYFQAKAKLFRPSWAHHCVIDTDCPAGARLAAMVRQAGDPPVTTVGTSPDADVRILGRVAGAGGCQTVTCDDGGRPIQFTLGMPGDHNAHNAVLAIAMVQAAGFTGEATWLGLANTSVPGRMQIVDLGDSAPHVIVDFGHTPEAVEAAMAAIAHPSIAVVGCGGDRDAGKRPMVGAAAVRQSDIVIVTDDNPRTEDPALIRSAIMAGAVNEAKKTGIDVQLIDGGSRPAAIRLALSMASPDSTVAVLGRGDETFQDIDGQHIPMSDVDLVRSIWHELKEQAQ